MQIDGDSFVERGDDEMDLSDEENPMPRKKTRMDVVGDENNQLKDENTNLRCQMEAYKNEVDVIKMDLRKELDDKEKQFKMLQQTLHGMQQQLLEAKKKQTEEENRVKELQLKLKQTLEKNTTTINLDDLESDKTDSLSSEGRNNSPLQEQEVFTDKDARLVGIISAFLNVHPFGAGLDYIWSYVSKLEVNVRPSDLELLMSRFPSVFSQEVIGIGANIERRWLFSAFKTPL